MLTGFRDLDNLTGGFSPGDLVCLAARPQMGKTSLALSVVKQVVERGEAVVFFSLEMNAARVTQRLVSANSLISAWNLTGGYVKPENWPKLVRGVAEISRAPLWIEDSAHFPLRQMREKIRVLGHNIRASHGTQISLVVVDYLQLMLPTFHSSIEHRRHISDIVRGLKIMARDLEVPVLLVARLGPQPDRRYDKRPWLWDLCKELEPIELFADTVMFLYRDEFYNPDSDGKGVAEVIVAKQRSGPTGKIVLAWQERFGRFVSLTRSR